MMDRINRSLTFIAEQPFLISHISDIQFLYEAAEFRKCILASIANAKHRIYLTALYLEDDEAGQEIWHALNQAKQSNPALEVVVLVDFHRAQRGLIGQAADSTNATFYQQFAQTFNSDFNIYGIPVKSRELFGVLHLKGFVFDDQVLYSGASLNNIYLNKKDRYRYDRYCLIKHNELADSFVNYIDDLIKGDFAVVPLNIAPIPTLTEMKGQHKQLRRHLKRAQYQYSGHVLPKKIEPDCIGVAPLAGFGARGNKLNQMIRHIFHSTRRELILFTPYFNFPAALSRDIAAMLKRGVSITLVVGDKTANDFYIPPSEPFKTIAGLPYLYEVNLRKFAKRHNKYIDQGSLNIHLWRHETNSFHLKGIYSDSQTMLLTGNNLNPRAWRLDLENGLLLQDKSGALADMQEKELELILAHTTRINHYKQIETLEDYPQQVQRLLGRMRVFRADNMVKRIL
ncbi:CDP-diacylglycerol--serine O-phosphatidyltransferase [Motilimonas sp. E26]|uniref:CDP-diacylglycerol--serine O-phosphatidyltransferase n=1 Tax=Motilimonas sp. E26 TaxID=2865674 RepID=UPI001E6281F4|nr:CDP-diacylglycerol--serine O-phosphatidyltransferase [Motilimonas sp. E26]MCE0556966.1 CDP-diacylglycerol--serine O-phosphatidyltransferase [Motilimonas sp. E26]